MLGNGITGGNPTGEGGEDVVAREGVVGLEQINTDKKDPNGYLRDFPDTMGILEYSPDGVTVHQIDQHGLYSSSQPATMRDGSSVEARKITLSPIDGGSTVKVYANNKAMDMTAQSHILADSSKLHYIFVSITGVLSSTQIYTDELFKTTPITALVYLTNITTTSVIWADERHGINMPSDVHLNLHKTVGAKYISGMSLTGMVASQTTMTGITYGSFADEDVQHEPATKTELPHIWMDGTTWRQSPDTNLLGYIDTGDTYCAYNKEIAGQYSLVEMGGTGEDYSVIFFLATNDSQSPYKKIVGQSAYATVKLARNAIESERKKLNLVGLPSPEFVCVAICIINKQGQLQTLDDGSLYLDMRTTTSVGASSPTATDHSELTGLDGTDVHPIESLQGVDSVVVGVNITELTLGYTSVILTTLYGSLSIGSGHSIYGLNSVVIGATNTVGVVATPDTDFNVCIGENCTATGKYCIALGDQSEATGLRSLARGYKAYAYDYLSTSIGRYTVSDGRCSFAAGEYVNTNNINYGVVFGAWNIQKTDLILCIGNGNGIDADPNEYSNRLEQFINGNLRLPTLQLVDIVNEKSVTTVEYVHTPTVVTETGMATYTPDFSRTVLHEYIITQATTVTNPINALKGQTGTMLIAQGATAYAITLDTQYQLVGTLTAVADEVTMLRYTVVSATKTTLEVVTTY